jgi:phosphoglycerate dehydrogenase-like enzyme
VGKQHQIRSGRIVRNRTRATGEVVANVPNPIQSTHMAGLTDEAQERVQTVTVRNVLRVHSES